jgi:hypothetical protein
VERSPIALKRRRRQWMQYKQVLRIGLEIVSGHDTPPPIQMAVARLFAGLGSFPRLGPYRKRSPEQALWRMASNSQLGGAERWEALRQLLQMMTTTAEGGGASVKAVGRTDDRPAA